MAKLPVLLSVILLVLLLTTYQIIFSDKFFPGIYIGDTNLFALTKAQAAATLSAKLDVRSRQNMEYSYQDKNFQIDLQKSSVRVSLQEALDQAFSLGREGFILPRLSNQITAFFRKMTFKPQIDLALAGQTQQIAQQVSKPSQNAILQPDLTIVPERIGQSLDEEALILSIKDYLIFGRTFQSLPIKTVIPDITTAKVERAKNYLILVNQNPIKLTFQENSWTLDAPGLLPLLDLAQQEELISKAKLADYLSDVASQVNQPLHEAQFSFDPTTSRVSTFQPAQEGRELDIEKTSQLIELALSNKRPRTITLPVNITESKIPTSEVNNLGIRELIGRGISNFAGSIPNRIYNVGLTASKINGVLIPPGQIFSFNQTVGDITAATGFKQAYVIKEGRTVLDDGGGVCQDSTTLFRAVLNAGLPVLKRTAHAYRVGYYEQGFPPGLDATVFYPTVDFQFKNDTAAHILIQAYTVGSTLYVDLYGTPDGRVASLTKPIVTDQTPPPPDLRQDDPTLPKGTVKQVDFSAWGANVSFQRVVKRAGQIIISETWKSSYKPWQAIYLVGTKTD